MRIVVMSDSHKNFQALELVVLAQPEADVFLHLGDGEREFDDLRALFPDKRMLGVIGNCDWGSPGKAMDMLRIGRRKLFFTHGHTFSVKAGTGELAEAARSLGADIALYGHTHVARAAYEDGLYIMNPGSVAFPRQGPPSYGIVDVTPAGIVTGVVPLENRRRRR